MATLIKAPTRVTAAGNAPKLIDEYVGRVNNGDDRLSIAHMRSPSGWKEPGQKPEFDEYTVVLAGTLRTPGERGRVALLRLFYGLGRVLAFGVGSIGAFMLFGWPPYLRQVVLGYLVAALVYRSATAVCRFVLAPGEPASRLVPIDETGAAFWLQRIATFVGRRGGDVASARRQEAESHESDATGRAGQDGTNELSLHAGLRVREGTPRFDCGSKKCVRLKNTLVRAARGAAHQRPSAPTEACLEALPRRPSRPANRWRGPKAGAIPRRARRAG